MRASCDLPLGCHCADMFADLHPSADLPPSILSARRRCRRRLDRASHAPARARLGLGARGRDARACDGVGDAAHAQLPPPRELAVGKGLRRSCDAAVVVESSVCVVTRARCTRRRRAWRLHRHASSVVPSIGDRSRRLLMSGSASARTGGTRTCGATSARAGGGRRSSPSRSLRCAGSARRRARVGKRMARRSRTMRVASTRQI